MVNYSQFNESDDAGNVLFVSVIICNNPVKQNVLVCPASYAEVSYEVRCGRPVGGTYNIITNRSPLLHLSLASQL